MTFYRIGFFVSLYLMLQTSDLRSKHCSGNLKIWISNGIKKVFRFLMVWRKLLSKLVTKKIQSAKISVGKIVITDVVHLSNKFQIFLGMFGPSSVCCTETGWTVSLSLPLFFLSCSSFLFLIGMIHWCREFFALKFLKHSKIKTKI